MKDAILSVLRGQVGNNSNPIHPALVHVPLVLFPVAAILRALSFYNIIDVVGFAFAHYFNLVALLWAIPTALTGFAEYNVIRDEETRKKAQQHMLLNMIVVGIGLYNWWSVKDNNYFIPLQTNVILGLISIVILFISGHLGGELVFKYGMGVKRQRDAIPSSRHW